MPLAMKTIVSVFATVQTKNASVPPDVALDEVDVALDDAAEADQLVACAAAMLRTAITSLVLLGSSRPRTCVPVAAKNASSSVVGAVAALELVDRLEAEQLAVVEDPDPVGERLGLGEVVRAEQDRRVVARRGPRG